VGSLGSWAMVEVHMTEGVRAEWLHVSRGMSLTVVAVLIALLGGCTPSASDVDPVPAVASGPRLFVSEKRVSAGDVIELHIQSPQKYTWGPWTSLKERRDGKWKTVYFWPPWAGEEVRISEPFSPGKLNADYPIAFVWDASFKLRIPDLASGVYRITKRFTSGPKGREDSTPEVEIEVVP